LHKTTIDDLEGVSGAGQLVGLGFGFALCLDLVRV
jgi:hypothetical protein